MVQPTTDPGTTGRGLGYALLGLGLALGLVLLLLIRLTVVTDYLYHRAVKDPERRVPAGPVLVAPADGTVLYVREVSAGLVPEVIKQGVAVPVVDLLKTGEAPPFGEGYLIGIYMNTFGVHINRAPVGGIVRRQYLYNGPHMDMSEFERKLILTSMVPGWVSLRRLLGWTPHGNEDDSDFILESARETLLLEDERGGQLFVVRIADYYVGKILTWVEEGQRVERGQRLGMISWGSQTDLYVPKTPDVKVVARVGDYVYAGETVLARYGGD